MRLATTMLCAVAVLALSTVASADNVTETNSAVLEWGTAGTGPVTSGAVLLYPSDITLAGVNGDITDVNVTLNGVSHTWSDDLEVALAFNGTIVELWNDAGGSDDPNGDVTFDDQAAAPIDDGSFAAGSGTFQVSAYSVGINNPAATGSTLADFNGQGANGTWSLYVWDDAAADTGSIAGGWTLNVVTSNIPEPTSAGLLACGLAGLMIRRRK